MIEWAVRAHAKNAKGAKDAKEEKAFFLASFAILASFA